ncbi:hypothetical protein HNY73_014768 [Argiope bruennichi]|uniref:Uncharacterized protein n=1 Tax=Argiope bruennichi TaxID=94029 RepID=A0A8T0ERK9_ARGBR|nr:hypothetical protein HNY73_014768 [Argiope bruennichi]
MVTRLPEWEAIKGRWTSPSVACTPFSLRRQLGHVIVPGLRFSRRLIHCLLKQDTAASISHGTGINGIVICWPRMPNTECLRWVVADYTRGDWI